ncbi:MAG: hypothetical protein RBR81_06270 [Bacteroidales bacterium]|nr:hypothetical protein [Bacteroidales bacterium]
MKSYVLLLLIMIPLFSCKRDEVKEAGSSELILTKSASGYTDAIAGNSSYRSDPFDLRSMTIAGNTVTITVSYPGGCMKHTFEIIWNETLTDTRPSRTDFVIIHNANGDGCEAYITDTLIFEVADLVDTLSFDTVFVNISNASDPGDSASFGGWNPADTLSNDDGRYDVVFRESDICEFNVTAARVICGAGLWDNLWLALGDSISTGIENYYFHKYLQPVAIDEKFSGFVPVQGKRYSIGARIQRAHPYLSIPVCEAWSGPSEPVRIMCIEQIP